MRLSNTPCRLAALCGSLFLLFNFSLPAAVIYVDASRPAPGNGNSWATAYPDLQAALDVAVNGDEIWVAQGTYLPTDRRDFTDPRSVRFAMVIGVGMYGGFAGGETQRHQRDWQNNVTTLSGDLSGDDGADFANYGENAYNVVYNDESQLTATAVLDGFTLSGGNATGNFFNRNGGGLRNERVSPTIRNCRFVGNHADSDGGGMYSSRGDVTVINCSFLGNRAINDGGGMYISNNNNSTVAVSNCRFAGNQADKGGGVYNTSGPSPTYTNCSFSGNRATRKGGGMCNAADASPVVVNCTFSGNWATDQGGAIRNDYNPELTLINSLINNNRENGSTSAPGASVSNSASPVVTYTNSLVQNITTGTGGNNLDGSLDPLFVSAVDPATAPTTAGDLRLQAGSPVIDAGDKLANPLAVDLDGQPRIQDCLIDLGAYEAPGTAGIPPLTVTTPQSQTVGAGLSVSFSVSATGSAPLAYQWQRNGQDIPGATAGTFTIQSVGFADAGEYRVRVIDACNPAELVTTAATLTVIYNCPSYIDNVVYVTETGTGLGASWADATDLETALNAAEQCGVAEVWVAAGTYLPTARLDAGEPRSARFVMREGVAIYGGFAGTETQRSQRDWLTNVTTLSGDRQGNDGPNFSGYGDNVFNVLVNDANQLTAAAVLDGFTVRGGNANGNNTIRRSGGGLYNKSASPTLANCRFLANRTGDSGGGAFIRTSAPTLINCRFAGNQTADEGGGMYVDHADPVLVNCVFSGNHAVDDGGGLYNSLSSTPMLTNCSFSGNRADKNGGAIYNSNSGLPIRNCLIQNNQQGSSTTATGASVWTLPGMDNFSNCLVQNITNGASNGNLDGALDPLFVTPVDPATAPTTVGDLRLQLCSPVINAGESSANPTNLDLAGNDRVFNSGVIDLGAYEYQGAQVAPTAPAPTGAAVQWTGALSSEWQNSCNWGGQGIPGASNTVTVPNNAPHPPALQPNTVYATQELTLQSGVQLTVPYTSTFNIGGTLLLDGATLINEGTLDPGATTLQNGGVVTNRGRVE